MTDVTPAPRRRWQSDVFRLSGFQLKTLVAAAVALLLGAGGMLWAWIDQPTPGPATSAATVEGGRSLLDGAPADAAAAAPGEHEPTRTWGEWFSNKGVKLGAGFLGGFAIGFAARAYIKTVAVVAGLVTVLLGVASYFQLFNIDFSAVKTQWAGISDWLLTQGDKLKDVAWAHLPSSTAGFAGLFIGMIRK